MVELLCSLLVLSVSPSPRRAWIEIFIVYIIAYYAEVALPTEGVD